MTSESGFRRAKIVCTVGPASADPEVLRELFEAGMNAVRLNFSHATREQTESVIESARDLAREYGRPLAVIADLQGPRIRISNLPEPIVLEVDQTYCFVPEGTESAAGHPPERCISTTYSGLAGDLPPGDTILVDDGRIELRVEAVEGEGVVARSLTAAELRSQKGMNLPGVEVGASSFTAKDEEDLAFVEELGIDYVALSFVRRGEDVEALRRRCSDETLIISKIEKDQALSHLPDILRKSDGVMVARGDLGVELPYEEVPMVQKRIIQEGQRFARPSITATQMLDSMTDRPRPTRAEVSDVANALLDGTDAVMLSGETAIGKYPVEAARTMERIIRRTEQESGTEAGRVPLRERDERAKVQQTTSAAIAAASMQAIERLDLPFVVTLTRSGFTARVMSAQRPPVPILAVTDQWRTYNQLALVWGVYPVLLRDEVSYRTMVGRAREEAVEAGFGEEGDGFVVTAGVPFHVPGTTNMMRIEEL
jgi:pyruvate kinase